MRRSVGIVDYGCGNIASVRRTIAGLGYRAIASDDVEILSACDALVLPGVGAFPAAMKSLERRGLVGYLQRWAAQDRPLLGLCLGMQLLLESSAEQQLTPGLAILPGRVVALQQAAWHIGWNTLQVLGNDPWLTPSHGDSVYFNHSFEAEVSEDCRLCIAKLERPLVAGIRGGRVVGLQFHPEKSQQAGLRLLRNVLAGLCEDRP